MGNAGGGGEMATEVGQAALGSQATGCCCGATPWHLSLTTDAIGPGDTQGLQL